MKQRRQRLLGVPGALPRSIADDMSNDLSNWMVFHGTSACRLRRRADSADSSDLFARYQP